MHDLLPNFESYSDAINLSKTSFKVQGTSVTENVECTIYVNFVRLSFLWDGYYLIFRIFSYGMGFVIANCTSLPLSLRLPT